jgi:hypothetical protein
MKIESTLQTPVQDNPDSNEIVEKTKDVVANIATTNAKFNINDSINISKEATESAKETSMANAMVLNYARDSVEIRDKKYNYDFDQDGNKETLDNLKYGSVFLGLDSNKDGRVSDASELVGVKSGDAFKELAKYDDNNDGWINKDDAVWKDLRAFKKIDHASVGDVDFGLDMIGIKGISLNSTDSNKELKNSDGQNVGNVSQRAEMMMANGSIKSAESININIDNSTADNSIPDNKAPHGNGGSLNGKSCPYLGSLGYYDSPQSANLIIDNAIKNDNAQLLDRIIDKGGVNLNISDKINNKINKEANGLDTAPEVPSMNNPLKPSNPTIKPITEESLENLQPKSEKDQNNVLDSDTSIGSGSAMVLNYGRDSVAIRDKEFNYDFDQDGNAERLNNIELGSIFLGIDRNKDGKVNNASELVGNKSKAAFEELKEYDKNGDGWINQDDDIWNDLRAFKKIDHANVGDIDMSLDALGIKGISLDSSEVGTTLTNPNGEDVGNIAQRAALQMSDGRLQSAESINLDIDNSTASGNIIDNKAPHGSGANTSGKKCPYLDSLGYYDSPARASEIVSSAKDTNNQGLLDRIKSVDSSSVNIINNTSLDKPQNANPSRVSDDIKDAKMSDGTAPVLTNPIVDDMTNSKAPVAEGSSEINGADTIAPRAIEASAESNSSNNQDSNSRLAPSKVESGMSDDDFNKTLQKLESIANGDSKLDDKFLKELEQKHDSFIKELSAIDNESQKIEKTLSSLKSILSSSGLSNVASEELKTLESKVLDLKLQRSTLEAQNLQENTEAK